MNQTISKLSVPTGNLYLGWRLRKLIENSTLEVMGDTNKTLRDFSVKLPGGSSEAIAAEDESTDSDAETIQKETA